MGYINEYDYLYKNPADMDSWRWFLARDGWAKEITDPKEVEGLAGKKQGVEAQWVKEVIGGSYDTYQLEVKMLIDDGSVLCGGCGNPDCADFPSCLNLPADIEVTDVDKKESWLPFGLCVARIVGYVS